MHLHLFLLAALTCLFTPSLSSPSDILYIQKLTADFSITLDTKAFDAFDQQFLKNATYQAGLEAEIAVGIPAIKKTLAAIVGTLLTQGSVTTQSISLASFDCQGSASRASAITYAIITNIGKAPADKGKVYVVYGFWKDVLVKTGDFAEYGGWRFSARVFQSLVSCCCGNIFSFFFFFFSFQKKNKPKEENQINDINSSITNLTIGLDRRRQRAISSIAKSLRA